MNRANYSHKTKSLGWRVKSMLYYSTDKRVKTYYSEVVQKAEKLKCLFYKKYRRFKEMWREDTFAPYYSAEDDYFEMYPNSAESWYDQLREEYHRDEETGYIAYTLIKRIAGKLEGENYADCNMSSLPLYVQKAWEDISREECFW